MRTEPHVGGVLWLPFEKTGSDLLLPHIYVRLAALLHINPFSSLAFNIKADCLNDGEVLVKVDNSKDTR